MKNANGFRRGALALVAALALAGCGGGGDSGGSSTGGLTPAQQTETAFVAKVASIALWATPRSVIFKASPTGASTRDYWSQTPGTFRLDSCATETRSKTGAGPTSIDAISIAVACTNSHANNGTGGGTLVTNATLTESLVGAGDLAFPSGSAWQHEERSGRQGSSEYNFFLLNGLPMDGKGQWNWSTTFRAEHQADGSQRDVTTHTVSASETSQRGNSNYTINASITCSFASTAGNPTGQCANNASRLTGTVYGQSIDASIVTTAASADTYIVEYAGGRITVVLESATGSQLRWRYSVKTTSGLDFVLLGEDRNWLGAH